MGLILPFLFCLVRVANRVRQRLEIGIPRVLPLAFYSVHLIARVVSILLSLLCSNLRSGYFAVLLGDLFILFSQCWLVVGGVGERKGQDSTHEAANERF